MPPLAMRIEYRDFYKVLLAFTDAADVPPVGEMDLSAGLSRRLSKWAGGVMCRITELEQRGGAVSIVRTGVEFDVAQISRVDDPPRNDED
jgi:hypothetical protein